MINNKNIKKVIYITLTILPIIIILVLNPKITVNKKISKTIPLIITRPTSFQTTQTSTEKVFNSNQKITFNLKSSVLEDDKILKNYSVKTSIVESLNVENIISKLNFYPADKVPDTTDGSFNWFNSKASLIISARDNYLYYQSHLPLPISNNVISAEDIVKTANKYIEDLLGSTILNKVEVGKITYYKTDQTHTEEEPKEVTVEDSDTIKITFTQSIDSIPVATLSQTGEILSVTIDKNKKLYSLVIKNGFTFLEETGNVTTSKIKETNFNSQKNITRVNSLKNMSYDKWYRNSNNITVEVESVYAGYLSQSDRILIPAYFISGSIKAPTQENQTILYAIPIPESL